MKREKFILWVTFIIVIGSGAIIYIIKSPDKRLGPTTQNIADAPLQSVMIKNQIENMKSQLQSDPDNFDLLVKLGNAYYDVDDAVNSVKYYEKALAINPDNSSVLVDCGAMYRALGNADKAIEMFNRAIKLDPSLPQAYYNLGTVLSVEKNDIKGAAEAWKKYLELVPNPGPQMKSILEKEIAKAEDM